MSEVRQEVSPAQADPRDGGKARLKAFSALASQGAAIIRSRSMSEGDVGASFGDLSGFWKCWSDGAHMPREGVLGIGGLVANEEGAPVAAFSLGAKNVLGSEHEATRKGAMLTELRALEQSLHLAWEAGARKIEARFDCLPLARAAAAALMGSPGEASHPESASLLAIMTRFECIALRWVPREENRMADALSKRPSGGGLFHGGASQAHLLEAAWLDPEHGLDGAVDAARPEASRSRRELALGAPMGTGVSAAGVARIALGARWSEGEDGSHWVAAASMADPAARRDARLEPGASWALGKSSEPGAAGLSAALSQALAKKGAEVSTKASGSVKKFSVHIPQSILSQLSDEGYVQGFVDSAVAMLKSLAPGSQALAQSVESSSEVSSRHALRLVNGWELGRAAVMQQLSGARSKKRLARSQRPGHGGPRA